MSISDLDTDELLRRAADGGPPVLEALFSRHRDRLARMIAVRMDPRLRARVDPSDVVQETLAAASQKLPQYLLDKPIAFYPWLRQIAWEHLVHLHDRHLRAARRSVSRENAAGWRMPDQSSVALVDLFVGNLTSPSNAVLRQELRLRVREAMNRLAEIDREVLIQRYLEQLSSREIAEVLGISENAVNKRHVKALTRMRKILCSIDSQD